MSIDIIDGPIYEPRDRYIGRTGIYPKIINYDTRFANLKLTPILANDLDLTTREGRELFNELVYSKYEGDVFTNIPRCPCGHTTGGDEEGELCKKCGYECQAPTEQDIESLVWIKAPEEVGYFMNPQVYAVLTGILGRQGCNVLDWLMDPKYRAPRLNSEIEVLMTHAGIQRGMKYLYENFDEVLEKVITLRSSELEPDRFGNERTIQKWIYTPTKQKQIREFVGSNRDCIFSQHMPFPSKIGFIIENVGNIKYIDPGMKPALNAMISIAKAKDECRRLADIESRIARATSSLSRYYYNNEKDKVYHKQGITRKLIYGTIPHFTFRSVITSEHLPHDHETIRIPWGAAVLLYKLHIGNKLLKEHKSPNEWMTLIYDNVQRRNLTLDRIFDELIEESPGGRGTPILFTRYPSLKHNSSTRYYAQIKRNPQHMSTSISVLTIKSPNADHCLELE